VEIVSRHGYLCYLKVNVLTCEIIINSLRSVIGLRIHVLKESLNMAGGMLWSSTIKAMRKKKDHSTLS
jgi:hypothetical protein